MKIFLRFLKTLLVGAVLSAFISNVFSAQKRPNVIIVNLDDLGAGWLSPYTKNLKPSDMDEGSLTSANVRPAETITATAIKNNLIFITSVDLESYTIIPSSCF